MSNERRKLKIALVSSHGGHFREMMALEEVFEKYEYFYITYRGETTGKIEPTYYFDRYFKKPLSFLSIWLKLIRIFLKEKPDAVFSTGAELAIPVFYVAKFFFRCKLVYLECSAQVTKPSLTGRIVYPITDLFLVQWETLLKQYGKRAVYRGGLL